MKTAVPPGWRVIQKASLPTVGDIPFQCNLEEMSLRMDKQAENTGGGDSVDPVADTAVANAGGVLGMAGGIMTVGVNLKSAPGAAGVGLMAAGLGVSILTSLLSEGPDPLTEEEVLALANQGDQAVVALVNEQMQVVEGCFDELAKRLNSLGATVDAGLKHLDQKIDNGLDNVHSRITRIEDHRLAVKVWEFFNQKIGQVVSAWEHVRAAKDAVSADERFEEAHMRCADIRAATHEVETNPHWFSRGIQYAAPLVHDWASYCFAIYLSWSTVHVAFPNNPRNAAPEYILDEAVRVFEQFETFYSLGSLRIHRQWPGTDAGILRTFQKYTSNFASNLYLAQRLSKKGLKYPALPPRAERVVCPCSYKGRGGSPGRYSCRRTRDPKEVCPRRVDCSTKPGPWDGFETCRIDTYSQRDICRICRDTQCEDRGMVGHSNRHMRAAKQEECFELGGIYIPNW